MFFPAEKQKSNIRGIVDFSRGELNPPKRVKKQKNKMCLKIVFYIYKENRYA